MASVLSGEAAFKLRGAVNPMVFGCRHLALLAPCHLFSRQATRKSDVATQVRASLTIFELSSVTSNRLESSLKCSTAFKASFQKKMREKRALASQLCQVRATQALTLGSSQS
jgi:hypothetical protein